MIAQPDRSRRPWFPRWWLWGVIGLALALIGYGPFLRAVASVLAVDEHVPKHVDAVFVMSGDNRFEIAASCVQSGFTATVLLAQPLPNRTVALGIVPSDDVFARSRLRELNVPDEAIDCLVDTQCLGEWRELRMLDDWLTRHPGARVVVSCARLDGRLTRYALDRVLSHDHAGRVSVRGLESRTFDEALWWQSRSGMRSVFASYLALCYAWFGGEDFDDPVTWNVDSYEEALSSRVGRN